MAKDKPFIIDDDFKDDRVLFPKDFGRGYVERDYALYPEIMFAHPDEMSLIPESEWDARIEEQEQTQSSIQHIRSYAANGQPMVSKDQNGQGYCWAYSLTRVVEYSRVLANQPFNLLSAHSVACKVKNFRDEGGWCGLSAKFIRENGIVPESMWPAKSMSRSHDTAANWTAAKKFATQEDWVDLARSVYDQNLTFNQLASCLLRNQPCAVDFNWWGHSVCAIRLVKVEAGSYGVLIDNSWTNGWGDNGLGVLRGSKMYPNGAIGIRVVKSSN